STRRIARVSGLSSMSVPGMRWAPQPLASTATAHQTRRFELFINFPSPLSTTDLSNHSAPLHRQLSLPEDLGNEAVEHRHFTLQDFESFGMNQPLANHRQRFEQEREVKPDFAFHPALDLTSRSLAKAKHSLVHQKLADLSSGRNVA